MSFFLFFFTVHCLYLQLHVCVFGCVFCLVWNFEAIFEDQIWVVSTWRACRARFWKSLFFILLYISAQEPGCPHLCKLAPSKQTCTFIWQGEIYKYLPNLTVLLSSGINVVIDFTIHSLQVLLKECENCLWEEVHNSIYLQKLMKGSTKIEGMLTNYFIVIIPNIFISVCQNMV